MRFAQLVMGPAGSGKSTYCSTLATHAQVSGRRVDVVNLDPAAEHFTYEPLFDVRDLIQVTVVFYKLNTILTQCRGNVRIFSVLLISHQVEDVMEDESLRLGPNGGLVFCWEFLLDNPEWLQDQLLGEVGSGEIDDDYILFDCPGQIELYTHMNVVRRFVGLLHDWNFRVCGVFLIDSHFMVDGAKFLSGAMAALSVMINLEVPHVNVLSKIDLLSRSARKSLDHYLDPDTQELTANLHNRGHLGQDDGNDEPRRVAAGFDEKYQDLTLALAKVLDDYSLVRFLPLDITDEENIADLFLTIDNTLQYGEDADVKVRDFDEAEEDGEGE